MGLAKRQMDDAAARLFRSSAAQVCTTHILDDFIQSQLAVHRESSCELCGNEPVDVFDFDDVLDLVVATIRHYRRRAHDDLYYDSEGPYGYAFPAGLDDTNTAVYALFEDALDARLLEAAGTNIEDEIWYRPDVLWLEGAELHITSWENFSRLLVDGSTPITSDESVLKALLAGAFDIADSMGPQADGFQPSEVLPRLRELFDDAETIVEIPATTVWMRARHADPGTHLSPSELGTVPDTEATENRMSRAGRPLFYGASDQVTATTEIGDPSPGQETLISEWQPTRPLRLLDLVRNRPLPNYYDLAHAELRWQLEFLAAFARDVSRPVGPHNRTEYRATQTMMEYLLSTVPDLDGIVYSSSHTGEPCCAFNIDNDHCVPTATPESSDLELVLTNCRSIGNPLGGPPPR